MSFPFDLHSAAVSDSRLPCHARAMLRLCRSSRGHGTARLSRDGPWAIPAHVRLLPATEGQRWEYAGPRADHDRAAPEYRYLERYATANTDYVDYGTKDIHVLHYGI